MLLCVVGDRKKQGTNGEFVKLEFVVETDHVGGVEFTAKGADKSMLGSSHGCAQGEYRNIYSITVMMCFYPESFLCYKQIHRRFHNPPHHSPYPHA